MPRYHVEVRSGSEYHWHAGSDDKGQAERYLEAARRTGYCARLRDTKPALDEPELTLEEIEEIERTMPLGDRE